jgi:hypothetical protein
VRGLGLVNWRVCIGAEEKGSKSFYDTKGDNSFILFSGCAAVG